MATQNLHTPPSFFDTPSRVAVAGDWHANVQYAQSAIEHARRREADVIVQLGDFGFDFTDDYLDTLDRCLSAHELVLGFVDGNHENFDRLLDLPIATDGLRYLRPRIVHLPRGLRWRWGTVSCLAVGGAYSIDRLLRRPHRTWWPQETITDAEVADISSGGHADVMFCHDSPDGVDIPGPHADHRGLPADESAAARANRIRLAAIMAAASPDRLWHGHYHYRYESYVITDGGHRVLVNGLGRDKDPIDNNLVVSQLSALAGTSARAASSPSVRAS
ncbi:metallophosphatase [Gordonia sp. TBRC 11910]|uniref:Metallophosphatase n=1 Tax=Gordonia asplenii TaxID=2725283 RepID=A0A848LAA7_9ACTN|nr:metallophosphoesterase [Gordonia asplenii]NMO04498.1 metallophosphatase [Gordonia asplenii]